MPLSLRWMQEFFFFLECIDMTGASARMVRWITNGTNARLKIKNAKLKKRLETDIRLCYPILDKALIYFLKFLAFVSCSNFALLESRDEKSCDYENGNPTRVSWMEERRAMNDKQEKKDELVRNSRGDGPIRMADVGWL